MNRLSISFQLAELHRKYEYLLKKLRDIKRARGWLAIYTKDVYNQETMDKLKPLLMNGIKSGSFVLPSEFIDRIVFIDEDQSQYKMWLLLEKAKKNVIFIPVGNE